MEDGQAVPQMKALAPLEFIRLLHAGAAAANTEDNFGTIPFTKARRAKTELKLDDELGGPRADQIEAFYAQHHGILEGPDVYMPMNTMAWFSETKLKPDTRTDCPQWRRMEGTTRYLNCFAIDWDFHDGMRSDEEMLASFNHRRFELALPEPNIILFSGCGLWSIWLLADEEGKPSVRAWPFPADNWRKMQAALIRRIGQRADPRVSDLPRLIRVAGSIHSKSSKRVRAFLWAEERYTIAAWSRILEVKAAKATKNEEKREQQKRAGHARVATLLAGLEQIVERVWRGHIPQGHRRDFLWVYARVLCMSRFKKEAVVQSVSTLAAAAHPPLDPAYIEPLVGSAAQPWDWNRLFSYDGLFEMFAVQLEQRRLITAWVKEPRADGRTARREQQAAEQASFDRQVAHLRDEGLTREDIASQVGCSIRTVASSIHRIKSVQKCAKVEGAGVLDRFAPDPSSGQSLAHFWTPRQARRRDLIRKLGLVYVSTRDAMKVLSEHRVKASRGTVYGDQMLLMQEDVDELITARKERRIIRSIQEQSHEEIAASCPTGAVSQQHKQHVPEITQRARSASAGSVVRGRADSARASA